MRTSPNFMFILLSGILFGLAAAATAGINGAQLWMVFLLYVLGGQVGLSTAAIFALLQERD